MISQEKARQLRALIEKVVVTMSDTDALDGIELFPAWKTDAEYDLDVRIRYDGKLYKCVQAHTSQTAWIPPETPALWTEVARPGEIPVWKQPTGAQDAYRIGDKVHYPDKDGQTYICIIDYNTYAPDVYGWEAMSTA